MRSIGANSARTHLYRILEEVAAGETVTITRRGKPVAQLVPVGPPAATVDDMLERVRALRKENTLRGLSIRELIDEGRKY